MKLGQLTMGTSITVKNISIPLPLIGPLECNPEDFCVSLMWAMASLIVFIAWARRAEAAQWSAIVELMDAPVPADEHVNRSFKGTVPMTPLRAYFLSLWVLNLIIPFPLRVIPFLLRTSDI